MQRRNFILLIIILFILLLAVLGFLYLNRNGDIIEDPGGTNFLSQFNPFATTVRKPPVTEITPADVSDYVPPQEEERGQQVFKVSSVPIAGYTVFLKERYVDVPLVDPTPALPEGEGVETQTPVVKPTPPKTEFVSALRYVDRATGNIYQTFADKIDERKFSSTLVPKVYEVLWGNAGETVLMRYLKGDNKTIDTFAGKLPKEILGGDSAEAIEIHGVFLPANITDLAISADGKNAFYLSNSRETTMGTVAELGTDKKTQVFTSSFNEWLSYWTGNKTLVLATKASYLAPGYIYKLDLSTKGFFQLLGGITGLTVLPSPDGKMLLYADNTLALSIFYTDTKLATSFGVRTLPEKCVWGKGSDVIYCAAPKTISGSTFPDVWYQGELSFDDQIWRIDVATGSTSILLDPAIQDGGEEVDGIKLALNNEENYLFFVNKKDSFLWKMNLK